MTKKTLSSWGGFSIGDNVIHVENTGRRQRKTIAHIIQTTRDAAEKLADGIDYTNEITYIFSDTSSTVPADSVQGDVSLDVFFSGGDGRVLVQDTVEPPYRRSFMSGERIKLKNTERYGTMLWTDGDNTGPETSRHVIVLDSGEVLCIQQSAMDMAPQHVALPHRTAIVIVRWLRLMRDALKDNGFSVPAAPPQDKIAGYVPNMDPAKHEYKLPDTMTGMMDSLATEADMLHAKMVSFARVVGSMEQRMDGLNGEITRLKNDVAEKEDTIAKVVSDSSIIRSKLEEATNKLRYAQRKAKACVRRDVSGCVVKAQHKGRASKKRTR